MRHYLFSSAVLVLVVMLPIQPLADLLSGAARTRGLHLRRFESVSDRRQSDELRR
jgi:hypothetical protein